MDDVEKLSCKEEILEMSDLEHSATDELKETEGKSKKKRRRRRDMDTNSGKQMVKKIKLSDDDETDDEVMMKKMMRNFSPGPNSPASHREPRTCVLKASQKRRPLSRLLEQLLRNLEKRDPHQFFAWPVNDNFAPGYSTIIKKPMDFSTMKQKIDDNEYKSLNCFISDFKLMCNNAMKYNKPGTVYHKAARRLLHAGLKQLTPHKLRPLGDILTYMYEIPIRELGFDMGKMDVQRVLKRNSPVKSELEGPEEGGGPGDAGDPDSVRIHMEAAREQHRRRLAKKAFPRMDSDGKTTLCVVTNTVEGSGEDKPMTLGKLIGKLNQGTGTLYTPREDRRNLAKGVKPLNYGPFSSYAPSYDGTFATLTKEESHLIYHTLPSETGLGNEETLRFAPDSPWAVIYDMETLFPDKKQVIETPSTTEEDELSKVKIDLDQLRSLSSLGVDVEWLCEVERASRDLGLGAALTHTASVLQRLQHEQHQRLSSPPPWHLSLSRGASSSERELARQAGACLRGMAARVAPGDLVHVATLRKAMGVTLEHLDTPMAVDDFEMEMQDHKDFMSDPESMSSHDK